VWVTNIVPLRGMGGNFLSGDAALLPIRSFAQRNEGSWGNYRLLGDRYPSTPNEPNGMAIVYYLKTAPPPNPAAANAAPQGGRGGGGRGGFGGARCVSGEGLETSITIADGAGKAVCVLAPASRAGINRVIWNLNNAENGPAEPGEYTVTLKAGGKTYVQKARLVSRAPEDSSRGRGGRAGNDR